jgi:CubicO group peptidase (beta-lactamase class C family)
MTEPAPTTPDFEWETSSPLDLGMDHSRLASAAQILAGPGSNAAAFIVIKQGKIVWEQYFEGAHPQDRHHLFSITKSVVSALIGIAQQAGILKNVDQPILDFFPEILLPAASPFASITLHHLLTMTSGLIWPHGSWGREPLVERMRLSPDWAQFILSLPIRREEIGVFHYSSASSHLLSAILTRAAGMNACNFAKKHLFAPLGISPVVDGTDWETDPNQNSLGGWGLHLSARELARIGWLYICDGQWHGKTIIPSVWVAESTLPPGENHAVYGYQWWLRQVAGERVLAGLGVGGQFMFCVPRQETVVVILSKFIRRWPDRWELLRKIIA